MKTLDVATEILNQLGGNRFIVMTGAKNFVGSENALWFSLPARFATNGINKVRITLTPMDEYTVEFFKLRGTNLKLINKAEGVYNDNLREVFTENTGLYTSM